MSSKAERRRRRKLASASSIADLIGFDAISARPRRWDDTIAEKADGVATDARVRHGLAKTRKQARDQRSGYPLGRLWRDRLIGKAMHDAGVMYADVWRKYLVSIDSPRPWPKCILESRGDALDITPELKALWQDRYSGILTEFAVKLTPIEHSALDNIALLDNEPNGPLIQIYKGLTICRDYFGVEYGELSKEEERLTKSKR